MKNSLTSKQIGSSMIEVLIAMVIMSFALLGIAGLLTATTKFQLGAENRSTLPMLFNDLAARIRVNIREVPGYIDASPAPAYPYAASWSAQQATLNAPTKLCGTEPGAVTCTSAELAAYDLWQSRTLVRRLLPQGALQIAGNISAGLMTSYIWFDKNYVDSSLIVAGTNPLGLITSATCSASSTILQSQTCCPAAANVSSTPGVRCINLTFIP